jgi:two-component system NtrC family sensor kinase
VEERETTEINSQVEKVLLLNRKILQNRGVDVVWEPGCDLPMVNVVPNQLQQVFLNLTLNAIEAMPDGGQLFVSTGRRHEPSGVTIEFTDSGIGISGDDLPRIFDAFHSTKAEGLGLGLYISEIIVEDHGGHIGVESQLGKGTTFTVWLPGGEQDRYV